MLVLGACLINRRWLWEGPFLLCWLEPVLLSASTWQGPCTCMELRWSWSNREPSEGLSLGNAQGDTVPPSKKSSHPDRSRVHPLLACGSFYRCPDGTRCLETEAVCSPKPNPSHNRCQSGGGPPAGSPTLSPLQSLVFTGWTTAHCRAPGPWAAGSTLWPDRPKARSGLCT